MVDTWGSAEWGWDVELFTPNCITFILLWKLYFKCIIQSGHEVTKEYFLCIDSIYGVAEDMWFEIFCLEL